MLMFAMRVQNAREAELCHANHDYLVWCRKVRKRKEKDCLQNVECCMLM